MYTSTARWIFITLYVFAYGMYINGSVHTHIFVQNEGKHVCALVHERVIRVMFVHGSVDGPVVIC